MKDNYSVPEWLRGIDPHSPEILRAFVEENIKRTIEAGYLFIEDDKEAKSISLQVWDNMIEDINEYLDYWDEIHGK